MKKALAGALAAAGLPVFGVPRAAGAKWKRDFYQPPRTGETDPGLLSVSVRPRGNSVQ